MDSVEPGSMSPEAPKRSLRDRAKLELEKETPVVAGPVVPVEPPGGVRDAVNQGSGGGISPSEERARYTGSMGKYGLGFDQVYYHPDTHEEGRSLIEDQETAAGKKEGTWANRVTIAGGHGRSAKVEEDKKVVESAAKEEETVVGPLPAAVVTPEPETPKKDKPSVVDQVLDEAKKTVIRDGVRTVLTTAGTVATTLFVEEHGEDDAREEAAKEGAGRLEPGVVENIFGMAARGFSTERIVRGFKAAGYSDKELERVRAIANEAVGDEEQLSVRAPEPAQPVRSEAKEDPEMPKSVSEAMVFIKNHWRQRDRLKTDDLERYNEAIRLKERGAQYAREKGLFETAKDQINDEVEGVVKDDNLWQHIKDSGSPRDDIVMNIAQRLGPIQRGAPDAPRELGGTRDAWFAGVPLHWRREVLQVQDDLGMPGDRSNQIRLLDEELHQNCWGGIESAKTQMLIHELAMRVVDTQIQMDSTLKEWWKKRNAPLPPPPVPGGAPTSPDGGNGNGEIVWTEREKKRLLTDMLIQLREGGYLWTGEKLQDLRSRVTALEDTKDELGVFLAGVDKILIDLLGKGSSFNEFSLKKAEHLAGLENHKGVLQAQRMLMEKMGFNLGLGVTAEQVRNQEIPENFVDRNKVMYKRNDGSEVKFWNLQKNDLPEFFSRVTDDLRREGLNNTEAEVAAYTAMRLLQHACVPEYFTTSFSTHPLMLTDVYRYYHPAENYLTAAADASMEGRISTPADPNNPSKPAEKYGHYNLVKNSSRLFARMNKETGKYEGGRLVPELGVSWNELIFPPEGMVPPYIFNDLIVPGSSLFDHIQSGDRLNVKDVTSREVMKLEGFRRGAIKEMAGLVYSPMKVEWNLQGPWIQSILKQMGIWVDSLGVPYAEDNDAVVKKLDEVAGRGLMRQLFLFLWGSETFFIHKTGDIDLDSVPRQEMAIQLEGARVGEHSTSQEVEVGFVPGKMRYVDADLDLQTDLPVYVQEKGDLKYARELNFIPQLARFIRGHGARSEASKQDQEKALEVFLAMLEEDDVARVALCDLARGQSTVLSEFGDQSALSVAKRPDRVEWQARGERISVWEKRENWLVGSKRLMKEWHAIWVKRRTYGYKLWPGSK